MGERGREKQLDFELKLIHSCNRRFSQLSHQDSLYVVLLEEFAPAQPCVQIIYPTVPPSRMGSEVMSRSLWAGDGQRGVDG